MFIHNTRSSVLSISNHRFTRPGDTILSVRGESNKAIEESSSRARRIEVVMADKESDNTLTKRIDSAFLMTYREGKFKVFVAEVYDIIMLSLSGILVTRLQTIVPIVFH